MPRIPLPKIKKWSDYPRYTKQNKRHNLDFKYVYNTTRWKSLRMEKLRNNPLCELCEEKGILGSAVEVHHITEISNGKTKFEREAIGFDYNNLMSLCKECHHKIHYEK